MTENSRGVVFGNAYIKCLWQSRTNYQLVVSKWDLECQWVATGLKPSDSILFGVGKHQKRLFLFPGMEGLLNPFSGPFCRFPFHVIRSVSAGLPILGSAFDNVDMFVH